MKKGSFRFLYFFQFKLRLFQTQINKDLPQKPTGYQLQMLSNQFNILTLETFRKNDRLRTKTFRYAFFLLFDSLVSFCNISYVNHCNFLFEKIYYIPQSFTLVVLNFPICKIFQKCYSNKMKKLDELETFGLLDKFCVKLKQIFIRSRYYSLQKASWTWYLVVVEPFRSSDS